MDMGHIRIFHDARNDQVMMSIEVSFIYTFFLSGKCRMRSCMSGAHYIIHFIFQNIVLSPFFFIVIN